jgi:hypothetical protein
MPPVLTLRSKPRRRKPVAQPSGPTLGAVAATADTNPAPDATVTPQIQPIKKLQAHLDKLQALYIEPNPRGLPAELSKLATWAEGVAEEHGIKDRSKGPRLPSAKELNQLGSCIEEVAKQLKISKVSIPYLHGVIKHIDRHYPKIGLEDFVAKLLKRITALPVPISTRIKQALAKCGTGDTTRVQALQRIQVLLKGRDLEPAAKDEEWRSLCQVVLEFTSPQFKQLVQKAKPSTMQPIEFRSCEVAFQGVLGFAAFHDLQRQHLIWMLDYEPKVAPVARWIYGLQNPKWDQELRRVFHGWALSPKDVRRYYERILANDRKNRWRNAAESTSKSVDKKPVQPTSPYKKRGHKG